VVFCFAVAAMVVTMGLLGFHLLLLPTFVVELVPLVDITPTWTECVIAVIALRKHAQRAMDQNKWPPPTPPATPPTIDIPAREDSNSPKL
jgi:hypothetical protein